jgi:hypothetical protein
MPIKPWQLKRLNRELRDYTFVLENDEETICFHYGKYFITVSDFTRYPFFPPQISIDGKLLSYTSFYFPRRLLEDYSKKHACPCCVSIMCPENWSPALGILDILKEYVGLVEKLKTFQKLKMFRCVRLPDDTIYEITSFF